MYPPPKIKQPKSGFCAASCVVSVNNALGGNGTIDDGIANVRSVHDIFTSFTILSTMVTQMLKKLVFVLLTVFILFCSAACQGRADADRLSNAEILAIFQPLTEQGWTVFWWYHDCLNSDLEIGQSAGDVDGLYYPVGKFSTIAEMKAASEDVFTRRFCEQVLYPIGFESTAFDEYHFLEIDGKLYCNANIGGMGWSYELTDEITVESQTADEIMLSVMVADSFTQETQPMDFALVKEDGKWKLNNWFNYGP